MEIELIQDGKGVDYNKYRDVIENVKESLFRRNMGKETKDWIYISNFVGILFDKNRLILSLPKSVIIKEDVDKETLLYKYARLFDLYFMVNEKKCDFIDKNGFIEYWCNQAIKENKTTIMTQEIITFKFEMVFEWMIGEFFHNQISIQKGDVLFIKSLDRMGRDYIDVQEQWRQLNKVNGVDIVILDMPLLDTRADKNLVGTLISDIVLQLLAFVAQTERENIKQRQREGIDAAMARGVRFGRPKRELPDGFEEAFQTYLNGKIAGTEAAKKCGLPYGTFYTYARQRIPAGVKIPKPQPKANPKPRKLKKT